MTRNGSSKNNREFKENSFLLNLNKVKKYSLIRFYENCLLCFLKEIILLFFKLFCFDLDFELGVVIPTDVTCNLKEFLTVFAFSSSIDDVF